MTYLDELRQSRNKPQVAFNEFMLLVERYPDYLFCFFEGKDNDYYVPRIKSVINNYHPIKCGGKNAVLHVHQMIKEHSEYMKYKTGYFIDRDFDNPEETKSPPIFETPCYSIENLYVSIEVFKEILANSFFLSEVRDRELFAQLLNLYDERQKEFHNAVLLFNAWYACLIEKKENEGCNPNVNLEENFPKGFISITLHGVISNYDIQKIKKFFPDATEVDETTLNRKIEYFKSITDQHYKFRGKYELEFLLKMIKEILADSRKNHTIVRQKIQFSFGDGSGLNQQQILTIFSPYAETPKTLKNYLKLICKTQNG
ncbi:MAG: DUF4435 domain-containing protein [Planctomycetaceae bacterium]|jgi:hypothetical protein|nr:DUF4435 domain-containing protein [Planctomycetaceae bacterium]